MQKKIPKTPNIRNNTPESPVIYQLERNIQVNNFWKLNYKFNKSPNNTDKMPNTFEEN